MNTRATTATAGDPLLQVEELSLEFTTRLGVVKVLDRVSFTVGAGERVAVVGESGSGKSVTAYAVLGLLERSARVTGGRIRFRGRDLLAAGGSDRRRVRGREIAMIFQSPRAALLPIRSVGQQLCDVLGRHHQLSGRQARERAIELLARVKITDPARRFAAYPFQLSGGMCQRVLIALALACEPALLLADEPTTGLDVTTQAAIVDLLDELAAERFMSLLFITHDLPLATSASDRIVVMHAGQVVEDAPTGALDGGARHPYTARLLAAVPAGATDLHNLSPIPGLLPDLRRAPLGCRYRARCERAGAVCEEPPAIRSAGAHRFACHHPLEEVL
jgi:peptide/nickel transport system ATP-binding protein